MTTQPLRTITVAMPGDSHQSLPAYVYGDWAAHKRPLEHGWTVTFLSSGRRCTQRKLTEEQAKKLADWLHANVTRDEMLDWGNPSAETASRVAMGVEMVFSGGGK